MKRGGGRPPTWMYVIILLVSGAWISAREFDTLKTSYVKHEFS